MYEAIIATLGFIVLLTILVFLFVVMCYNIYQMCKKDPDDNNVKDMADYYDERWKAGTHE